MRLPRLCLAVVLLSAGGAVAQTNGGSLPLQPTRSIEFTTDEGTWMSVDVAPDGRGVVFDLLGDLYIVPIEGGSARRITSGMAFDSQPRYSPDGRQLVFTSDRDGWVNVWVAASDGTELRQLTQLRWSGGTSIESPEWTPDGKSIVYTERLLTNAGQRLVELPLDGSEARSLTHSIARRPVSPDSDPPPDDARDEMAYRGPSFGADSRFVYAAARRGNSGPSELWQVMKIDRQTDRVAFVTTPLSGMSAVRPVLSPQGRWLVFAAPTGDGTGLRVRDLLTGNEKWLTGRAQRSTADVTRMSEDTRDLAPGSSFTPDGRELVASIDGKLWRIDIETGLSTAIPFVAKIEQRAGALARTSYSIADESLNVRAIQSPQLSPDGLRCVFTALDRIWVVSLSNPGAPKRLTQGSTGEFFPAWSSDGQFVAYASWSDKSGGALYRVRSDGKTAPELLTHTAGFYSMPMYSADGGEIVAVHGPAQDFRVSAERSSWRGDLPLAFELVRLPASGGALKRIGDYRVPGSEEWKKVAFQHKRPQRSVGADRVYLYDPADGLVSMTVQGSDRQVLLRSVTAGQFKAREVVLSPSGRYALALMPQNLRAYLFAMPDVSKGSAAVSLTDQHARQLSRTGVTYLGWTSDNRPYYGAGGALFIGDKPPDDAVALAPTFSRLQIDLEVAADRAIGSLLLKNARVVTMRGSEVIEHGDVLIRDGRIAAVGATGSLAKSSAARVLDVTGTTILPGYIDVHDHVGFSVSFGVHTSEAARLLVELAYGVTTLRDPFGHSIDLMAYGERAAAGDLVAPRIYAINANVAEASFGDGVTQDLAETRDVLRYWSDYYHTETIKQYMAGGRRTRQLVAMAALEQGLTPTNEGGSDTAMELTMALDGYGAVEHSFPAKPVHRDVIQLFALTDTILTPTLGVYLGWQSLLSRYPLEAQSKLRHFYSPASLAYSIDRLSNRESMWVDAATAREYSSVAARIVAAGGCVAMGSHGNVPGIGAHFELWYLTAGGLSNHDALRAGTLCGARSIGHEKDLGSIEPGKLADLQILADNPLEAIENTRSIRFVMKGGRLYEANTLDEVWPRRRSLEHAH